jgi:hypothetical protein
MLRRLIAWCVPDSALELRGREPERTDVGQALAPYQGEPPKSEAPVGLRVVGNP